MAPRRLAVISMHTSPLAQPGAGDGGGMNVYVDSLARGLARAGVVCDVLTRRTSADEPEMVEVEPGYRVVQITAGPAAPVAKEDLHLLVDEFAAGCRELFERPGCRPDLLHANYWLSGLAAHRLKHELDVPMVTTFHTLARVKAVAEVGDEPERREQSERDIVRCADLMLASTSEEAEQLVSLYAADPSRIEIVPPGVDHAVFRPGDRHHARELLHLEGGPIVLFVGRIQRLKGLDLAVRAVAAIDDPTVRLVVVGGPSGAEGEAELERIQHLVKELHLDDRFLLAPPQPHDELARWYQAADVCIVPSHSESFGLVALEAAACGIPVIAAAVGGLRQLVHDGVTGFLVDERDPDEYAALLHVLLADVDLAGAMGVSAAASSMRYSWGMTAARLRRLFADLAARTPVACS